MKMRFDAIMKEVRSTKCAHQFGSGNKIITDRCQESTELAGIRNIGQIPCCLSCIETGGKCN